MSVCDGEWACEGGFRPRWTATWSSRGGVWVCDGVCEGGGVRRGRVASLRQASARLARSPLQRAPTPLIPPRSDPEHPPPHRVAGGRADPLPRAGSVLQGRRAASVPAHHPLTALRQLDLLHGWVGGRGGGRVARGVGRAARRGLHPQPWLATARPPTPTHTLLTPTPTHPMPPRSLLLQSSASRTPSACSPPSSSWASTSGVSTSSAPCPRSTSTAQSCATSCSLARPPRWAGLRGGAWAGRWWPASPHTFYTHHPNTHETPRSSSLSPPHPPHTRSGRVLQDARGGGAAHLPVRVQAG